MLQVFYPLDQHTPKQVTHVTGETVSGSVLIQASEMTITRRKINQRHSVPVYTQAVYQYKETNYAYVYLYCHIHQVIISVISSFSGVIENNKPESPR